MNLSFDMCVQFSCTKQAFILILHRYDVMMQCWRSNPKDRPSFQELTLQLNTILSNIEQAKPSEYGSTTGEHNMSGRDSYLHPIEESEAKDDSILPCRIHC